MKQQPDFVYATIVEESNRLATPELVTELRSRVGIRMVAYIGSASDSATATSWSEGATEPNTLTIQRLRLAYRIVRRLEDDEGTAVAAAWMAGVNPALSERGPATVIREGVPAEVEAQLIAAVLEFVGS